MGDEGAWARVVNARRLTAMPAVRPARRSPSTGVLAALLGVLAAVAVVAPAAAGRVMLHQCLSAGAFAPLGLRLAVLRDAADCPAGSYGLGAAPQGAVLLLSVAVPALLAHVLLAACGTGVGSLLLAVRRRVAALGRRWWPTTPAPLAVATTEARFVVVETPRRHDRGLVVVRALRGPPAVA